MRKDIDLSFIAHPLTGDLVVKTNSDAIKQAVRNIVLTGFYKRGFNIEFGTNVRQLLFDLNDFLSIQTVRDSINQAIKNFEPQAELTNVQIFEFENGNGLRIDIYYYEINNLEEKFVSIPIS